MDFYSLYNHRQRIHALCVCVVCVCVRVCVCARSMWLCVCVCVFGMCMCGVCLVCVHVCGMSVCVCVCVVCEVCSIIIISTRNKVIWIPFVSMPWWKDRIGYKDKWLFWFMFSFSGISSLYGLFNAQISFICKYLILILTLYIFSSIAVMFFRSHIYLRVSLIIICLLSYMISSIPS